MRRLVGRFAAGLHWRGLRGYRFGCQGGNGGAQGRIEGLSVMVKVVARPLGQGQHPLAHWQRRQDMIDQVSGRFGHAPAGARGTDGAALAGEGDEEILSALPTTRPGEAIGRDATLEVGTQLALGRGRDALILPIVVTEGEEGLEMVLHRTVERCVGGTAPAQDGGRASLRLDGPVRIPACVETL